MTLCVLAKSPPPPILVQPPPPPPVPPLTEYNDGGWYHLSTCPPVRGGQVIPVNMEFLSTDSSVTVLGRDRIF
jgi:hypothetical protein